MKSIKNYFKLFLTVIIRLLHEIQFLDIYVIIITQFMNIVSILLDFLKQLILLKLFSCDKVFPINPFSINEFY